MVIKFIPKGSMCMSCRRLYNNCSTLPFSAYKLMEKEDAEGYVVVRCQEYRHKRWNF